MKIYYSEILNQSKCNKSLCPQLSFRSMGVTYGIYKDCYGVQRETQNTTGMRTDLSLEDFAKIIKARFKNFKTVNIMPLNVSDGTEAYLFANAIIRNEGWEKFITKYKIDASDVMPNVIKNYAQNGLLHLYNKELEAFDGIGIDNVLEKVDEKDYKDIIIPQISYPDSLYKLNDKYRNHFNFSICDLQDKIRNLNDEGNCVIAIRNCLIQSFGGCQSALILSKLARAMQGASLLITGDYDRKSKIINDTLKDLFIEIKHNIWKLKI